MLSAFRPRFKIQLPRKSPLKLQCCKMRLFGECFQMLCKTFASCTAWKAVLDAWKNVVNLFFRCNLFFFFGCRTTRGFMHMKIQERSGQGYILGQFSKPFRTIAQMLLYYSRNSLPVKGIEHISLKKPVCEQLLWLIKKNQLVFWKRNFFLGRKLFMYFVSDYAECWLGEDSFTFFCCLVYFFLMMILISILKPSWWENCDLLLCVVFSTIRMIEEVLHIRQNRQ